MVRSHGLTHISLAVRDLERSVRFYTEVFGVREYFRDASSVQVLGPGPHDVIAFERNPEAAGLRGGITHFGFRLRAPDDVDAAVAEVERAGGSFCDAVNSPRDIRSLTSPIRTATRSRYGMNSPSSRMDRAVSKADTGTLERP